MKKKQILAVALVLVMALGILAACAPAATPEGGAPAAPVAAAPGQQPAAPATPDHVFEVVAEAPPEEAIFQEHLNIHVTDRIAVIDLFNPAFGNPQIIVVCNMIFNNLIHQTVDGNYEPELAHSWHTDDWQTFTFYLRDDVYFHNGERFTAHDVAFTIYMMRQSPGTQIYNRLNQIVSYEIVDDFTIILTLRGVNVDFEADISTRSAAVVNRVAYETCPDTGPWIGTGPWIVSAFESNDFVTFVRNENFWDPDRIPVTQSITFRNVAEETARLIMFENGDLDFLRIDPAHVPTFKDDPRFVLTAYTANNLNSIGFNMLDPLMADLNFRRAVAHAFNPYDYVAITLNGFGIPATWGTFWGYRTEFRNDDIPGIPFDLDRAREYLALTAYAGETLEIVASTPHAILNAQVFQAQMAAIGIDVDVFQTDGATFATYAAWGNSEHQFVSGSSVWSHLASSVRATFYPGQTGNRVNYNNPVVAEMLDRALETFDRAEREAIYREVQEIIAQDIPYIGIFHMVLYIAGQEGTGGFLPWPNNNHDWSQAFRVIG